MKSSLPHDLGELVRQAQAGSEEAAGKVYELCQQPLIAVIRHVLAPVPALRRLYDSDDFLQETFEEIFKRHFSDEVLKSPKTLWPYLARIAQNKVLDAERRYLGSARHSIAHDVLLDEFAEPLSHELSAEDVLWLKELVEEKEELIAQLPALLQKIIGLSREGHNGLQIAAILGLEPKRVYRATK